MGIKLFYKSQVEVGNAINELVDQYWANIINEPKLLDSINKLFDNNPAKALKGNDFTTAIKQKCGKRRLEVVARILKLSGKVDLI